MGLFDGIRQEIGRTGASADIAALFGWPVILVLDVSGHAQSAAAVALGCARYDPRIAVAGVVLNKVASERHRRLVEDGMARIGLPVLGALMRDTDLTLPERHLGLVQAGETEELDARLERPRRCGGKRASISTGSRLSPAPRGSIRPRACHALAAAGSAHRAGRATAPFPSSIRMCSPAGARRARRSFPSRPSPTSLRQPDCDVCWLPGGYPELHAGRIAAAHRFLGGLRSFRRSQAGSWRMRRLHGARPLASRTADGVTHAMAGLLPVETSYAKRKMHLGYRVARLVADGVWARPDNVSSAMNSTMPRSSTATRRRRRPSPRSRMRKAMVWALPAIAGGTSPAVSSTSSRLGNRARGYRMLMRPGAGSYFPIHHPRIEKRHCAVVREETMNAIVSPQAYFFIRAATRKGSRENDRA